jgi:hypothetical protein
MASLETNVGWVSGPGCLDFGKFHVTGNKVDQLAVLQLLSEC